MLAAACDKESALLHKQQSLLAKRLRAAEEELALVKGGQRIVNLPASPSQSEEVGGPATCISAFGGVCVRRGRGDS